jgi:hypothetical protein
LGREAEVRLSLVHASSVSGRRRLDLVRDGTIVPKAGEEAPIHGPTEAGTKRSQPEEVKLSEIIEILNDRFGTEFRKADQLAIDSVAEELKADETVQQHANVNPLAKLRARSEAHCDDPASVSPGTSRSRNTCSAGSATGLVNKGAPRLHNTPGAAQRPADLSTTTSSTRARGPSDSSPSSAAASCCTSCPRTAPTNGVARTG